MTPRELAAAIRKGAAMRPQCTGTYFDGGGSCAIGAALEGIGVPYVEKDLGERWYDKLGFDVPSKLGVDTALWQQIFQKNDGGMTREQIADWLDTLEPETKPADKQSFDAFMATVMQPVPVTA